MLVYGRNISPLDCLFDWMVLWSCFLAGRLRGLPAEKEEEEEEEQEPEEKKKKLESITLLTVYTYYKNTE